MSSSPVSSGNDSWVAEEVRDKYVKIFLKPGMKEPDLQERIYFMYAVTISWDNNDYGEEMLYTYLKSVQKHTKCYFIISRILRIRDKTEPNDFVRNNPHVSAEYGTHVLMVLKSMYPEVLLVLNYKRYDSDGSTFISEGIEINNIIPRFIHCPIPYRRIDEPIVGFDIVINDKKNSCGYRILSRFGGFKGYGGVFERSRRSKQKDHLIGIGKDMVLPNFFGIYVNEGARLVLTLPVAVDPNVKDANTNKDSPEYYKFTKKDRNKVHHDRSWFFGDTYIHAEGLIGFLFPDKDNTVYTLAEIHHRLRKDQVNVEISGSDNPWLFLKPLHSQYGSLCWHMFFIDEYLRPNLKGQNIQKIHWCLTVPKNLNAIESILSIDNGKKETNDRLNKAKYEVLKDYQLTMKKPVTYTKSFTAQQFPALPPSAAPMPSPVASWSQSTQPSHSPQPKPTQPPHPSQPLSLNIKKGGKDRKKTKKGFLESLRGESQPPAQPRPQPQAQPAPQAQAAAPPPVPAQPQQRVTHKIRLVNEYNAVERLRTEPNSSRYVLHDDTYYQQIRRNHNSYFIVTQVPAYTHTRQIERTVNITDYFGQRKNISITVHECTLADGTIELVPTVSFMDPL